MFGSLYISTYVLKRPIRPSILALKTSSHLNHAGDTSDHPVAFVRGGVRDDVAALGGVALPVSSSPSGTGAGRVQMSGHLLCNESVQVDVLEAVAPAAAHRPGAGGCAAAAHAPRVAAAPAHVRRGTRSARAHADARHGAAQT